MRFISPLALESADISERVNNYWNWKLAANRAPRHKADTDDDGTPRGHIAIGLDLGFSVDHSALCAVEALPSPDSPDSTDGDLKQLPIYALRKIEKWQLHTPYQDVLDRTCEIYHRLRDKGHSCVILLDIGGARGVYEMLRDKDVSAIAVQFIGSGRTQLRGNTFYIVKQDMAATLSIVTNPNKPRLKVPPMAKHARELKTELRNYEIRVSENTGSTTFGAFAHKTHDDIVSALGIALQYHQHRINRSHGPRVRWI